MEFIHDKERGLMVIQVPAESPNWNHRIVPVRTLLLKGKNRVEIWTMVEDACEELGVPDAAMMKIIEYMNTVTRW